MEMVFKKTSICIFAVFLLSSTSAFGIMGFINDLIANVSASHMTQCFGAMGTSHTDVIGRLSSLETACAEDDPDGGGINVEACNQANSYRSFLTDQFGRCVSNLDARESCQSQGGQWFTETDGDSLFQGVCKNCHPDTITATGAGSHVTCLCPEGSTNAQITPAQDISSCGIAREESDDETCVDPGPFANAAQRAAFEECSRRVDPALLQAAIDAQRRQNQEAANIEAERLAAEDLEAKLTAAEERIKTECEQAISTFNQECSNLTLRGLSPGTIDASRTNSAEGCNRLHASAESGLQETDREVRQCRTDYSSLTNSCPVSTPTLTGSGSHTVRTRESELGAGVVASADDTATDSRRIRYDGDPLSEASTTLTELNEQVIRTRQALNRLDEQAEACVAAFEEDPENAGGNDWSGLAQTAAQAFGNLDENASGNGSLNGEVGVGRFSRSAATAPGFNGANSQASGSAALRSGDDITGFNPGGGDFNGSLTGASTPTGVRNSGSQGDSDSAINRGAFPGVYGMGYQQRGQQNEGDPATNATQDKVKKNNFSNSEKRNLVLGYKKVKKGDGNLTYHPDDLKKHGKEKMLRLADEARKKFGEKTPLIFQNGEFVRDYLEMKNRLAWQKHNLIQKNRLSGIFNSSKEQEAKAFHQCALYGECYTESRYNIFKLHHYKAIRHIGETKN